MYSGMTAAFLAGMARPLMILGEVSELLGERHI